MDTMKPTIEYSFAGIKVEQFATFKCDTEDLVRDKSYNGDIQVFGNYNERIVGIRFLSELSFGAKIVMKVITVSLYELSLKSWELLKKNNSVVIPLDLLWHFGGLAVSTTRGIVYAKTEGTDLNRCILPPLHIDKIINKELVITSDNKAA